MHSATGAECGDVCLASGDHHWPHTHPCQLPVLLLITSRGQATSRDCHAPKSPAADALRSLVGTKLRCWRHMSWQLSAARPEKTNDDRARDLET